jgi:hypothetical protein
LGPEEAVASRAEVTFPVAVEVVAMAGRFFLMDDTDAAAER